MLRLIRRKKAALLIKLQNAADGELRHRDAVHACSVVQLDAARPDIVQRHAVKTRAGELDDPQARKELDGIVEEQAVAHDRLVSLRIVYRCALIGMYKHSVPGSFQLLALAAIELKRAGHQNVHAFIPLTIFSTQAQTLR